MMVINKITMHNNYYLNMVKKLIDLFSNRKWQRHILFSIIGGGIGYAYYYFIGCNNGTCLISGNPYISTLYGVGIGLLVPIKNENRNKEY